MTRAIPFRVLVIHACAAMAGVAACAAAAADTPGPALATTPAPPAPRIPELKDSLLKRPVEWFASDDARKIELLVLASQNDDGGWPKNLHYSSLADPAAARAARGEAEWDGVSTIDNDATTLQMGFLARVHAATGDPVAAEAALRGLRFLLALQYPNGGWPQTAAGEGGYHREITYNDNAMIRTLIVVRQVARGEAPYDWVPTGEREAASGAVKRGIACILATQVRDASGGLTVWCAQHDAITLAPAPARAYEPASLSGSESVGIVDFLMSEPDPSPAIRDAVEGAVAWFASHAIKGQRLIRDAHPRLVPDPDAPLLWARFYELGTERPLFMGRDRVPHYSYTDLLVERSGGYGYIGHWADELITTQVAEWRARVGARASDPRAQ